MMVVDGEILRQCAEHCRDGSGACRDAGSPQVFARFAGAVLACLVALAALLATGAASASLPQDSVYRVEAPLTSQDGRDFAFGDSQGHVRLATMFYATCPYVCPLIVDQIKAIEHQLEPGERERLRVLLITLEAEKDTPEVLADVARKRRIDTARWTLARPQPADLRKLSAVLGVQYRKLPDGEFNHSSVITLLDPQGRVLAQTSRLGGDPEAEFVAAIKAALAAAGD
jgi:protein SCO1/2